MITVRIKVYLRKLPSEKWQVRFVKTTPQGQKEKTQTLPSHLSKRQAEREVAKLENKIKKDWDPFNETGSDLVHVCLDEFYEYKSKRDWSSGTIKMYKNRIAMIKRLIPNIPVDQVKEWYVFSDYAPASQKTLFTATRTFLKWCEKEKGIPYPEFKIPRTVSVEIKRQVPDMILKPELKALSSELLCHYYKYKHMTEKEYNPVRHIRLWHVFFYLLLRKEELFAVKPEHVKGDHILVKRKGGTFDRVEIIPAAKKHVDWFRKNQIKGKPFFGFSHSNRPTKVLHRTVEQLFPEKKRKGFHMFRHGGATHALENGVNFKAVSELLGHTSYVTTLKLYAHSIPTGVSEAYKGKDL